jgi:hypothetical protein
MYIFSYDDISLLILNHLDIKSIGSLKSTCRDADQISWSDYFLSNTIDPSLYNGYNIDKYFMNVHGKYLLDKDTNIIKQWLYYYQCIDNIIRIYDNVKEGNLQVLNNITIEIKYRSVHTYHINYSKEYDMFNIMDLLGRISYTKELRVIIHNIKNMLLIPDIIGINVFVNVNNVYSLTNHTL